MHFHFVIIDKLLSSFIEVVNTFDEDGEENIQLMTTVRNRMMISFFDVMIFFLQVITNISFDNRGVIHR